jgi:hypothetical protein
MGTVWFRQGTSLELPQTAPENVRLSDPAPITSSRALALSLAPAAYLDTALRLTAIALLLRPMGPWFVSPVILSAGVLVLIFPRALRNRTIWRALALLVAIRIADDWPLADNHIYLLCYWLLAVALALQTTDPPGGVAVSSRLLIGLAFAFAVLWKVALSPDFADGRFFRVTLLTDPRFGAASQLFGGLSKPELDANREAVAPLPHGAELADPPQVTEPRRLRAFAMLSTWGIVALEAAVAAMMLAPARRTGVWRHVLLLAFCGITYAFAPVAGFGWLLLVMGLAQVEERQVWIARLYVVTFLVVLFYDQLPWTELALDFFRGG